jgi:hypothetical protein
MFHQHYCCIVFAILSVFHHRLEVVGEVPVFGLQPSCDVSLQCRLTFHQVLQCVRTDSVSKKVTISLNCIKTSYSTLELYQSYSIFKLL